MALADFCGYDIFMKPTAPGPLQNDMIDQCAVQNVNNRIISGKSCLDILVRHQ